MVDGVMDGGLIVPTWLVIGDGDERVMWLMARHVGLGGQNFAERGQSPPGAPEISPYGTK
eukprot:scaffold87370_cov37-Cyclotella_meneghiniana.AAC.2